MKLLYVASSVIPSRSANSIHVMKMAAALGSCIEEVELCIPNWKDGRVLEVDDVFRFYGVAPTFRIYRPPGMRIGGYLLRYPFEIWKKCRKTKPDVIYGRSLLGVAGAMASGAIPSYLEIHAPLSSYPLGERMVFRWMKKQKHFRGLIVISHALKMLCEAERATNNIPLCVFHDGADIPCIGKPHVLPGDHELKIGYFGSLAENRGIDLIIALGHTYPDIGFHLFGGKPIEVLSWKRRAISKNLFFHGFIEPGKVPEYQQSCDILLAPYQEAVSTASFMSPLKIFESMASGRPIICSDLPVIREVLYPENSVLVPPKDIEAWKRAIEQLRDSKARKQLGDRARNDLEKKYSWNIRANFVKDLISNV